MKHILKTAAKIKSGGEGCEKRDPEGLRKVQHLPPVFFYVVRITTIGRRGETGDEEDVVPKSRTAPLVNLFLAQSTIL